MKAMPSCITTMFGLISPGFLPFLTYERKKKERNETKRPGPNILLLAHESPYPLPHLALTQSGVSPELLKTSFTENTRMTTSV